MITIAGVGIFFFLIFVFQRKLYQRLWQKNLQVQIHFATNAIFEGEDGALKEIIENRKRLPLSMLKVKFKTDRHLLFDDVKGSRTTDQFYRNDIFHVGSSERVTRFLKFKGGRRGYYTINGASLVASDLLMTTQMVSDIALSTAIYVYPKPYTSELFQQSLTRLNGEVLAKRHLLEDPFELRGIREYQPYDDIRSINWKATAKTGDLMVNQKNYTALKSVRVFLNLQDDNILKKEDSVEASIRIGAGLCAFFLQQGIQVSCFANGLDIISQEPMEVPAKAGSGQLENILRNLARLDLQKGTVSFVETYEETILNAGTECITCFVSPNQYDDFQSLLKEMKNKGQSILWFYPYVGAKKPEPDDALLRNVQMIQLYA